MWQTYGEASKMYVFRAISHPYAAFSPLESHEELKANPLSHAENRLLAPVDCLGKMTGMPASKANGNTPYIFG